MSTRLKIVVSTIIYFKLWVHMVNVHLCKKNHKNRVHQKKLLFLVTTKKTQNFYVLSIENGGFYNYLLLVVSPYSQCAFMQEKS